jgi:NAD(P)-dependent dehydrogenase (short-subunit alcohol dehydrogenase family)/acyl carrier protein
LKKALENLSAAGLTSNLLPVSGPFHSPLMASANDALSNAINDCGWHSPLIPVYSNVTARSYPADAGALRKQLTRHLLSPVEFVNQIERMYAEGARVFIELGPRNILTGLIDKILAGREHLAVAVEGKGGGLRGLLLALGELAAQGVNLNLPSLFDGRDVKHLDTARLLELTKKPTLSPTTWLVNGAGIRPQTETISYTGKLPSLTRETATQALEQSEQSAHAVSTAPASSAQHMTSKTTPSVAHQHHEATGTHAPASTANGNILSAYQAYQETMRQFLSLQEEALKHFLNVQQSPTGFGANPAAVGPHALVSPPSAANLPAYANQQPSNGNGNGGPSHAASTLAPAAAQDKLQQPHNHQQQAQTQSVEPASHQPSPSAELDRHALIQILINLVSEHTGYPPEMLGLDLDLEAELGVDSIKRIEILDGFQKRLPAQLASRMQQHVERFTKVKSLNELVETFMREMGQSAAVASTTRDPDLASTVVESRATTSATLPEQFATATLETSEKTQAKTEAETEDDSAHDETCPRYLLKPEVEPLPERESIAPAGLFLITEDELSVAGHVAGSLRQKGARAVILKRDVLSSPEELAHHVAELQEAHGPIGGIVHLAALAVAGLPETLSGWQRRTQVESKSLFQLLRMCADAVAFEEREWTGRVVSASLLGGYFGREGMCGPGLPTGGSSYGLLKSVAIEWPGMTARALDFDHELPAEEIAGRIVAELLSASEQFEVGYPEGRRTVFRTVNAPLNTRPADASLAPAAGWVLMLTGGAQGITAEAARALAVRGMRMIIVGRSPEPIEEEAATAGVEDVGLLRQHFIEQGKTDDVPLTPTKIENRIHALLKERAISRNLSHLRRAGVEVEYHAVDVRDEAAFGSLIKQVYARYGRLDAVIHGAGVIEDKLLKDKSQDSFDRVFDTKVDSTFILSRYLQPATLKLLVFFSSIAGRYGNRGQADYAAANEVMNRFAWRMRREFPKARVVAINWGPWASVGMASEAVNRQFKERGIVPIGARAGCRFLMEEISCAGREAAEVVAGEGPWGLEEQDAADDLSNLLLHINALTENFWTM